MRVLVCGDRDWKDRRCMKLVFQTFPKRTTIIEGGCRGADAIAKEIAEELGFNVVTFAADWKKHGHYAGPLRNQNMLVFGNPDIVFAFHSNLHGSRGTKDMVKRARDAGVETVVITGTK